MTERENITSEQLAERKALAEAREVRSHTRMARKAIPALVGEVERLRAEKIELNEGILDLQRMLCARDGVPMPSERPLVDKLRAEVERLGEVVRRVDAAISSMDYVPLPGPQTEQEIISRLDGRSAEYALAYVRAIIERACAQYMRAVLPEEAADGT